MGRSRNDPQPVAALGINHMLIEQFALANDDGWFGDQAMGGVQRENAARLMHVGELLKLLTSGAVHRKVCRTTLKPRDNLK